MARLAREWISVEKAQQWLNTYDPKWMSNQVKDAMVKEINGGKRLRWYHAIIVDQDTDICHEGLILLLTITKSGRGAMCWIARADDFHFSHSSVERTPQGYQVTSRKMDSVETTPLDMPVRFIDAKDIPEHPQR